MPDEDIRIKLTVIVLMSIVLLVSVIGLVVIAIFTDRDLRHAGNLIFVGFFLLLIFGGFSLAWIRRRIHWHIEIEEKENED